MLKEDNTDDSGEVTPEGHNDSDLIGNVTPETRSEKGVRVSVNTSFDPSAWSGAYTALMAWTVTENPAWHVAPILSAALRIAAFSGVAVYIGLRFNGELEKKPYVVIEEKTEFGDGGLLSKLKHPVAYARANPHKIPLLAQIGFQAAATVITGIAVGWHPELIISQDHQQHLLRTTILTAEGMIANGLLFFQDSKTPPTNLLLNPYLHMGVGLVFGGGTQDADALSTIANGAYISAFVHSVFYPFFQSIPKMAQIKKSATAFQKSANALTQKAINVVTQIDFPNILIGAGCAAAALHNLDKHDLTGAVAVSTYIVASFGVYALQVKRGVYEFLTQGAKRPEAKVTKPSAKRRPTVS